MPHAASLFVAIGKSMMLSRRSPMKADGKTPQSYAYVLQPLVHGKIDSGEDAMQALLREAAEEGGEAFSQLIRTKHLDEVYCGKAPDLAVYFVFLRPEEYAQFVPCPEIDSVVSVSHSEAGKLEAIDKERDKGGVDPQSMKLFPDHLACVHQLFDAIRC